MSLHRHPDPAIAAWLADGPTDLSSPTRNAISETVRTTRQRHSRVAWLPEVPLGRLLVLAGIVLATFLALAVAGGGSRLIGPQPTVAPAPAVVQAPSSLEPVRSECWGPGMATIPSEGTVALRGTTLSLGYAVPVDIELEAGIAGRTVAFGAPFAVPHHLGGEGRQPIVPGSLGVHVVDVTGAIRHGSLESQPRIGTDAKTFLGDLDTPHPYQNGVIDFEVDEVAETQVAGQPAWSARVSVPDLDPPMWSHIDYQDADRGCAVDFGVPNRVWVVDVGSSIVLIQAWASDDATLETWLPEATRLIETFRFQSEAP